MGKICAKFWPLLEIYTWNVPFQISKYATGGLCYQYNASFKGLLILWVTVHSVWFKFCLFTGYVQKLRLAYS